MEECLIIVLCRVAINMLQYLKTNKVKTHLCQSSSFERSTGSPWSSNINVLLAIEGDGFSVLNVS